MKNDNNQALTPRLTQVGGFPPLLETLRDLAMQARHKVLSTANAAQVLTYWETDRHIVEFEQRGETRAAYGQRLLTTKTTAYGRGLSCC